MNSSSVFRKRSFRIIIHIFRLIQDKLKKQYAPPFLFLKESFVFFFFFHVFAFKIFALICVFSNNHERNSPRTRFHKYPIYFACLPATTREKKISTLIRANITKTNIITNWISLSSLEELSCFISNFIVSAYFFLLRKKT